MSSITPLTPARRLARSAGSLSDVLVDALRREAAAPAGRIPPGLEDQPDQFALELDDELASGGGAERPPIGVAPSRCAIAHLLGRALDADRDALARLQDADAATLIVVSAADMVEPVEVLLKQHVLRPANVASLSELRNLGAGAAPPGTVAVFAEREDGRPAKFEQTEDLVTASRAGCALIGVAADPERLLCPELVRLAATRIVLPGIDGDAVRAVLRVVTGTDPGPVDRSLAAGVNLCALDLAVRPDLGAETSLRRLRLLAGGGEHETSGQRLADMHGLGEARNWALDLIADLKAYARGDLSWSAVPRGAVLWSLPGCGKTALARALAREAGCAFVPTSYAQWQAHREGHLGDVTRAIRSTFAEARQKAPCIVFIDELDTLMARSGHWSTDTASKRNQDWWHSIVNVLLEEIDGYERLVGVVVIGACNDPTRLDSALVRSGRLDRLIEIPLPDVPALAGILRSYLGRELAGDDLIDVALAGHGGTGADVERWVRDARALARRANRALAKADLVAVVRGERRELPDVVRRRVAYHEAGHAIAILATGSGTPRALSIGDRGGLSQNEPGERRALTRSHLEDHLAFLLAGRAAEMLIYGEGTAGAGGSEGSDLARATALATEMETAYGLGSSGLVYMPIDPRSQYLLGPEVREAVQKTLDRAHKRAIDLLARNRATLDALARALSASGYLDSGAIGDILARYPLRPRDDQTPAPKPTQANTSPPLSDETNIEAFDAVEPGSSNS